MCQGDVFEQGFLVSQLKLAKGGGTSRGTLSTLNTIFACMHEENAWYHLQCKTLCWFLSFLFHTMAMIEPELPKQCQVRGCMGCVARKEVAGHVQLHCSSTAYHRAWLVMPKEGKVAAWEFTSRGKASLKGRAIDIMTGEDKPVQKEAVPIADAEAKADVVHDLAGSSKAEAFR